MNKISKKWREGILPISASLRDAANNLNTTSLKIVMVVNSKEELLGTLSDGDIRRGLLQGETLDSSVNEVYKRNPLVVPEEIDRDLILKIMVANKIQQIPIVNGKNKLVGLHQWDEITSPIKRDNIMVIMAGGKGTRLMPLTEHCPKPMLEITGKPMLEHIIERAKEEGFYKFVISLHYMGHIIEDYFGSGRDLGVEIEYLKEVEPLGTAGALSLFDNSPSNPFVVTNGDVITDIRYGELLDFHLRHGAKATMAVRLYEWEHPFGVVEMNGVEISRFEEKPISRSHINAGVYVLNPEAIEHLNYNEKCDMPLLFQKLSSKGEKIVAYPMHEPWLDVGRPDDLVIANTGE